MSLIFIFCSTCTISS